MELSIKEPKDIEELIKMVKMLPNVPNNFNIKLENNIFSIDGKWLLKRQHQNETNKLQTISVWAERIQNDGFEKENETSLKSIVRRTVEDFKGSIDVVPKTFLYANISELDSQTENPFVTLSYMSVLESGNAADLKQWEQDGFEWYDIGKIDRTQLKASTNFTYGKIRENWNVIENILKQYKDFNQKDFQKYFFYGIENRQALLEGIIYYTNQDLNKKYLDLETGEKFPSQEEKLEMLKKKATSNCEQLYKFLNIAEQEDKRFDFELSVEEKEKVEQMVETLIQQLIANNRLMFFKRGIFYNDRFDEMSRIKGLTYDEIMGFTWTRDVYKVIQQLGFMEGTNVIQYYRNWLNAKFNRLKASASYSSEDLKKLQDICKSHFQSKEKGLEKS